MQTAAGCPIIFRELIYVIPVLKNRYKYIDISVLMKVESGAYIDLTCMQLKDERELVYVNYSGLKEGKYLLTFCTFIKKERYVTEITIDELLIISGIVRNEKNTSRYPARLLRDAGDELTAAICAKKIVDYSSGYVQQIERTANGFVYEFNRKEHHGGEPVLRKEFVSTGTVLR